MKPRHRRWPGGGKGAAKYAGMNEFERAMARANDALERKLRYETTTKLRLNRN